MRAISPIYVGDLSEQSLLKKVLLFTHLDTQQQSIYTRKGSLSKLQKAKAHFNLMCHLFIYDA